MKQEVLLIGANFLLLTSCLQPTPIETKQMGPLYVALPTFTPTATPEPTPPPTPTPEATPTPQLFDEALRPLFDQSKKYYFDKFRPTPRFYPPSVSPITIDHSKTDPENNNFIQMLEALEPQDSLELPKNFFIWPTYGPIFTYFGRGHMGIDIGGSSEHRIWATADGMVVYQKRLAYSYGYNMWVNHSNRFLSHYSHLSEFNVEVGDNVEQGKSIGIMGSTGKSTGPHLDLEVVARTNKGWYYIDPVLVLP